MIRSLLGPAGSDRRMYSLIALAVLLVPLGCLITYLMLRGATLRDIMSVGTFGSMAAVGIGVILYGCVSMVVEGLRGTTTTTSEHSFDHWEPDQPAPRAPEGNGRKLAA